MKRIFVSGCYDIVHAGHLQFFEDARALGDHLTVSFASEDVLWHHKQRRSSIPDDHKKALLESLRMVDEVVIGTDHDLGLDFKSCFLDARPDVLAVSDDDQYREIKLELCAQVGASYQVIPKTPPKFGKPVSTSAIVRWVKAPSRAPLRVDFAGGWLDVPRHARDGAYVVNCAISPLVSLRDWPYEKRAGLGGSGAWALLNGADGVDSELDLGVGWQDPAVIRESGLCVWRSGPRPVLDLKRNVDMLVGRMAILWTGEEHHTPGFADDQRDYGKIEHSGHLARAGVSPRVWSSSPMVSAVTTRCSWRRGCSPSPRSMALWRGNTAAAGTVATRSTCLPQRASGTAPWRRSRRCARSSRTWTELRFA